MNLTLLLTAFKKNTAAFLHRFHIMIFVIVVLGSTGAVILSLNGIIGRSSESEGYTSDTYTATFDQATIKRIKELKTHDQTAPLDLSKGRSNPFVE